MRVLFSIAGGTGHFHPLVPLAQAVQARGHDAAFVGALEQAPQIEAAGFRAFGEYHLNTPEMAAVLAEARSLPAAESAAVIMRNGFAGVGARARAADVLRVCAAWHPDVLVRGGVDFGACVAAERLGLPDAAVLTAAAGTPLLSPELIGPPLNDLRAAHGLAPDPDLAMLYRYVALVPFPRSFLGARFRLPATAHPVRPFLFDQSGSEGLPDWVGQLADRPTVHVTLGTAFNAREPQRFAPIVTGLRDLPINLIVTVGRNVDPAMLGRQPPNVHVERYIPLSLLLPHCELMVCHGGAGTVMAGLARGIPLVLLPLGADQPQNAERCAALGLARIIDPNELSEDAVREAVVAVLDNAAYRAKSERVRDEIAALPGPEEAVKLLERLAATGEPQLART